MHTPGHTPKTDVPKINTIKQQTANILSLDPSIKAAIETIRDTGKPILITVRENDKHNETLPVLYKILEGSKIPYNKRIFDRSISREEVQIDIEKDISNHDTISIMDQTSYHYNANKRAFINIDIDNIKNDTFQMMLRENYNIKNRSDYSRDADIIKNKNDDNLTGQEYAKSIHKKSLIYAEEICKNITMLMKDILVHERPNAIIIGENKIGHHFNPFTFIGGYKNISYPWRSHFVDYDNPNTNNRELEMKMKNYEEKQKYNDSVHKEMALKLADLRKDAGYTGDIRIIPYSETEDEKELYNNAERDTEDTRFLLDAHNNKDLIKNAKILSPAPFDMALELGIDNIIKKEGFEIQYISKILQEISKEIKEKEREDQDFE